MNAKWRPPASVLAHFDTADRKAPSGAPRPIATRKMLRGGDPGLFALVNEAMAYEDRVDWQYNPNRR